MDHDKNSTTKPLHITLKYLAGSANHTGCAQESITVPGPATLSDVITTVITPRHPTLAPLLPIVRWARNHAFASVDTPLADGDEIALLPPVAGGAPRAHITPDPIDPQDVITHVASPSMGATVVFIGTVRAHNRDPIHHVDHQVTAITYEAYLPMALEQLESIASTCAARYPDTEVAITHRQGIVPVGEPAVVIAAASPHRDQAFAACRETLEELKRDAAIWKKEHTESGEVWLGWGGG